MNNQLTKNPIFNMEFLNQNQSVIIASLGEEKAEIFKQNCMMYLASTDDNLKDCEPKSILTAMLMATNLGLPVNKSLGLCWVVPYTKNKKINDEIWVTEYLAQFQIGWKGYVSLAMQAGYSMVVADIIYEDQIIDNTFDEIGTYKFNRKNQLEIQKTKIEKRKIVGYYAVAKYRNFKAEIFWTKEEIDAHAQKYSDSLRYNIKHKLTGSTWQKEAEKMALKTMIRQVLGKNLVPNKKLLKAYEADMSAISLDGSLEYPDNPKTPLIAKEIDPRAGKENVFYDNFMLFAIEKTKEKTAEDVENMLKDLESKRFCEEAEANQIINALTENKDAGIIAEDKAIVLENYIKKITIKTEK